MTYEEIDRQIQALMDELPALLEQYPVPRAFWDAMNARIDALAPKVLKHEDAVMARYFEEKVHDLYEQCDIAGMVVADEDLDTPRRIVGDTS